MYPLKEKKPMSKNTYRVPAMTLPPTVMRDIRDEAKRTGQTVTSVVRARIVSDYEKKAQASAQE